MTRRLYKPDPGYPQLPQSENIEDRRHLGPSWSDVFDMIPTRADALYERTKEEYNRWLDLQPRLIPTGLAAEAGGADIAAPEALKVIHQLLMGKNRDGSAAP